MNEALNLSENCRSFYSWEWYLFSWQTTREKYAAIKGVHEPRYIAGIVVFPLGIGSSLVFYRIGYSMRANEMALNVL